MPWYDLIDTFIYEDEGALGKAKCVGVRLRLGRCRHGAKRVKLTNKRMREFDLAAPRFDSYQGLQERSARGSVLLRTRVEG